MGQVPPYLIVGSGRMAQHMQRYLDLLHLRYQVWTRKTNTFNELLTASQHCAPILLLIKDAAIAEFIEQHPFLQGLRLVHFSGQVSIPGIFSAHPLMTFGPSGYELALYQQIPFILAAGSPELPMLLPGLANPYYFIPDQQRTYYHALCVLSGNFTTLLWQKMFNEMEQRFDIPPEKIHPYLQQIIANVIACPQQALTGPLVRNDQQTIAAHLAALQGDDYQVVYQAFVKAYSNRGK